MANSVRREWPTVRLSEICEIAMGQAPKSENTNELGEGLPLIAGAGDFITTGIAAKKFTTQRTKIAHQGDLILSIRATIGPFRIADLDYVVGRGVAAIRAGEGVLPEFLPHLIRYVTPELQKRGKGATFLQVSKQDIASLEVALPPLDEQRRIAAILDKASDVCNRLRLANLTIRELEERAFRYFSMGCSVVPLEEVCTAIIDCPHSTPKWSETGEICLWTGNLRAGSWDWDETRFVSSAVFDQRIKRARLEQGDIILSREGTVGIAAIVPEDLKACLGQRLVQVRPHTEVVSSNWILQALLFSLNPRRISNMMVGATSKHLNVKDLRKLPVPFPSSVALRDFETVMTEISKIRNKLDSGVRLSEELVYSLSTHAFRGEL